MARKKVKPAPEVTEAIQEVAEEHTSDIIADIVSDLRRLTGNKDIHTLNSDSILSRVTHSVSTGSIPIDGIIRVGVPNRHLVPFGKMTEISGDEACGKTTLFAQLMANTQKMGGICAIADTEEALDVQYLELLGVDVRKVILIPALTMEEVFDQIESMALAVRKQLPDKYILIGWDSLGMTPTNEEVEKGSQGVMGSRTAKVVSENVKRIVAPIAKTRCGVVVNNHHYIKPTMFGSSKETPGGKKLKYAAYLRIFLESAGVIKGSGADKDIIIGHKIRVTTKKNKLAPGLRTATAYLLDGYGFSDDYFAFMNPSPRIVKGIKGGGFNTWVTPSNEEVKYRGWDNFRRKITKHPEYPAFLKAVEEDFYETLRSQSFSGIRAESEEEYDGELEAGGELEDE